MPAAGVAAAAAAAAQSGVSLRARPVPQWVAQSAVYQAALEGALRFDDPEEPGITPQQALAADVAAHTSAGTAGASGMAGIAAAPGTIAAWVYGDGLADSGPNSGAVDFDEVSLTAR